MWEGLQNLPQMNFNPGVAADSSANNSGIHMTYPALKSHVHTQLSFVPLLPKIYLMSQVIQSS